jgi:hypothetical protein
MLNNELDDVWKKVVVQVFGLLLHCSLCLFFWDVVLCNRMMGAQRFETA